MTLAHYRSTPSPSHGSTADDQPVSDFHLVEAADGWRLTVNVTDRLLEMLDGARSGDADEPTFTLQVEPNLLPGEPFAVTVEPRTDDR